MLTKFLLVFCLFPFFLCAQDNPRCEIWQYFGTDSVNKSLAQIITYNARGQMVTEQYIGWKTTMQEGTPDGTYTYIYNDTFLVKRIYSSETGDSSYTVYTYDGGRLIRQSQFELKSVGNTGGQLQIDDGSGKSKGPRRWEQTSDISFSYDAKGRKILYDASRLHFSTQNMYKWTYDDQNRVTQHQSYSRGKLTWQEDYQYFEGSYRYFRIWYDAEGNPRHENKESYSYYPLLFFTYTLDKQGRIIEEKITDENKNLHERTTTAYNKVDKIAKTVHYTKDEQSVTHIYKYTQ
ncbi:MAG TPA: hypothetical protein VK826_14325 [Bacteroidia bacterium]|nr:hypothetical protein [Bacteroidia bacterium]